LLRISVDEQANTKWLRLEGRVSGPWAEEFERVWREIVPTLDSKKFGVDLRGVTHMDRHGRRVLADIHQQTGAEFVADSPMTKFFAEEARHSSAASAKEEE
jgi:anti-anti-sigma regulatory factor